MIYSKIRQTPIDMKLQLNIKFHKILFISSPLTFANKILVTYTRIDRHFTKNSENVLKNTKTCKFTKTGNWKFLQKYIFFPIYTEENKNYKQIRQKLLQKSSSKKMRKVDSYAVYQ